MKVLRIVFMFLFTVTTTADSQNLIYQTSGTIEFEKRVNVHAILKETLTKDTKPETRRFIEDYIQTKSQFETVKSTLVFDTAKTLFRPEDRANTLDEVLPIAKQFNIVYRDLKQQQILTSKKFFDQLYLITDTIRTNKWKITDETKSIAGFNCRRANALLFDSVYVVAFYTTDIHVNSGPESFSGLPGMILQVTLPHHHVTWVANSVNALKSEQSVAPDSKSNIISSADFLKLCRSIIGRNTGLNHLGDILPYIL